MKKLHFKYIFLLILTLYLYSCKDFVQIDEPGDRITTEVTFSDDATATAAVNSIYARLTITNTATDLQDIANNNLSSSNGYVGPNFWRDAYEPLYRINICIENLKDNSAISTATHKQLLGECYFLRAFCYWYLVNVFGDVPLVLTSEYSTNAILPRSAVSAVNEQIYTDLLAARGLLTNTYPTSTKLRVNRLVANSLLARFCLYQQRWQDAVDYATEVISSNVYMLESSVANVFLAASTEAEWQFSLDGQVTNTSEANMLVPSTIPTIRPVYPMNTALVSAFETGDTRRTNWVGSKTVSGVLYYYPYKYKIKTNAAKIEHQVVFRLAEQYLIRAEAYARLNNRTEARNDLNKIRNRANLSSVTSDDQNVLIDAVLKERRIELLCEYGHRWFDLKRTGKLDETLSTKPGWSSTDQLFPIPISEILTNTNLTQNPGYN
jgi:hypothetical protein